mmetsp:Transcript_15855/g.22974  ORF Transcript_15855/g.22974 Transcript_15855/m.22974 type:complete len:223 (+) Transcript_15855:545-1213(+)
MQNFETAKALHSKLVEEAESGDLASILYRIKGAQQKLSVKWFVNRTRDPSLEWNAVILRGLSGFHTASYIKSKVKDLALRVTEPKPINGVFCCLVVMRSLQDAYTLIKNFDKLKLDAKIDLHPYSSMFKKPKEYTGLVIRGKRRQRTMSEPEPCKVMKLFEEEEPEPSTVETLEEGEIVVKESEMYSLFEYGGVCYSKEDDKCSHSGLVIKTSHVVVPDHYV